MHGGTRWQRRDAASSSSTTSAYSPGDPEAPLTTASAATDHRGFSRAVSRRRGAAATPPSVWSQLSHPQLDPAELQQRAAAAPAPPTSFASRPLFQAWSQRDKAAAAAPGVRGHDGRMRWFDAQGRQHRDGDLPAFIDSNGSQSWKQHGKLHRDGDQPAYVGANGTQMWYQHGQLHRNGDRPALISKKGMTWYQRGERHRENGPAVMRADGTNEWYMKDDRIA